MDRKISPQAWTAIAQKLGVDEACLRAVAAVESAGSGFLAPPDERPKILFEGHIFHRLTKSKGERKGRFDASAPGLSYPRWDRSKYSGSVAGEWKRLDAACLLDRNAALQSASWGSFQIMGFNYALCGFDDVEAFVSAHKTGAEAQLVAFSNFISRPEFINALRTKDWNKFARAYNGPGYKENDYHTKLAKAFNKYRGKGA